LYQPCFSPKLQTQVFLKKSLIKNLLRKGFIENGLTAWSNGAMVSDKPVQRHTQTFSAKF
jgi:hypothetical protein